MTGEPIRLLFVVPSLTVGGAERHLARVLPALDHGRFVARVVCINEAGALFAAARESGVDAVTLDRGGRESHKALRELVAEMRRFRPDVVITRGFNAETLGRIAARIARVPISVVWKHNCGDVERRRRQRMVDARLDRLTTAYFGVAFGQVPYLVNDLGIAGDKIRVIRNGVDPAEFTPDRRGGRGGVVARELGIDDHDRVVGILAVLREEKDHATFLRAGAQIVREVPDTRLLVVGDGPLRPELEDLAHDLGLGDRVIFAGMRSDVDEILRIVDAVVLSSYTVECFPFAILEAMGAAVPSVCTCVGGLPELVEDGVTGYLVPPSDPRGLAEGVVRLLTEPGAVGRMGDAARRRLEERFTLERSVRETERVLEELVAAARPRRGGRRSLRRAGHDTAHASGRRSRENSSS